MFRHLEASQVFSHVGLDGFRIDLGTGLHHDHRGQRLAQPLVGHAEDRALADSGMIVEDGLDLLTADVLTAADHHVLLAIGDEDVVFFIHVADIAGVHPAVGEGLGRWLPGCSSNRGSSSAP